MELFVGTSGYSYKEWKGVFYPSDLPIKKMLEYYGQHFRSVEINNTFYRMPKTEVVETWASQVPEDFEFVLKASRRITHLGRLKEVSEPVGYLFRVAEALGDKLGPILTQLPPTMKVDLERLQRFLNLVPEGRRVALEFRHPSWRTEAVRALLQEHGAAECVVEFEPEEDDYDDGEPPPMVATADWGYLRLRRCDYTDDELAEWVDRVLDQPWQKAYVFFKHEDEGTGPDLAERFVHLAET